MNKRLFVERKKGFDIEADMYKSDVLLHFLVKLPSLRYFLCYDIFNLSTSTMQKAIDTIIIEPNKDFLHDKISKTKHIIAVEYLPGQFDQRADALMQCVRLLDPHSEPIITSSFIITFDEDISDAKVGAITSYLINPVESRIKDLSIFDYVTSHPAKDEVKLIGFCSWDTVQLESYRCEAGLSMAMEDLKAIQDYFISENRDPFLAEIKVLDTYWSDHCRHTTFETVLEQVTFDKTPFSQKLNEVFQDLINTKRFIQRDNRPLTLMEMATINKRYEEAMGTLKDCEKTDEINAASIEIDVDVDHRLEKWLFMFKNETHNHPTEIEPFGGASTCIGGAIRDPLSGRSYVYGALRFTGAADITEAISQTVPGKLPQRVISKGAAHGYSSYGNQIGLATPYVKEVFHPNYVAKRLEVGAVFGAVPKENVVREKPIAGDIIMLIGGRTGRDGIGGATGSSKTHTLASIETASSEVQKGNAPEERKIQRLFRHPKVTTLIKKANDFGAGGVSVAVGELADGIDIYLEHIKTKYEGISGLELAISESQERMAVVIAKEDEAKLIQACMEENLEAYLVAEVTNLHRMRMQWRGEWIVDLDRTFLNTAGVRQTTQVHVANHQPLPQSIAISQGDVLEKQIKQLLHDPNIASLQGLEEMFDATIGNTTVLSPYGGTYKLTKVQGAVQKIPVLHGITTTVSFVTAGFNPYICEVSPYHGATYAILESLAKLVALGGDYRLVKFSFQEYFERLGKDPLRWGKPFQALLGAYDTLKHLSLASIGGKDSMSGSYQDIDVPPTFISFAFAIGNIKDVVSPELKASDHYVYAFIPEKDAFDLPNFAALKEMYALIHTLQMEETIVASYALESGGIVEALIKMSFGNHIGCKIQTSLPLFEYNYGSLVVEATEPINHPLAILIGKTHPEKTIFIQDTIIPIDSLIRWHQSRYQEVYPITVPMKKKYQPLMINQRLFADKGPVVDEVRVLVPVFPGTNCEYDTMRAFEQNGAIVDIIVIQTQNDTALSQSIALFINKLSQSHILVLAGGFSSGDEPDGSGKFIATFLKNELISESIISFIQKKHLILGICNGFQALVKSGLLPYGQIRNLTQASPTLFKNHSNRHVAKFVTTKTSSMASPWLSGFTLGQCHTLPISHGEGRFVVSKEIAKELFKNDQIAFQYVDRVGEPSMDPLFNPNGSDYAIEGIVSIDGLILGKMAHSERYEEGLFQNIAGNKDQNIFNNAITYFRRKQSW